MVVSELHMGDLIGPGTGVGPTEDLEVHFNFLIDMFHFSIKLEVIDSREGEVIVHEFPKPLDKGGGELWTSVRDNLVIESEA